MSKAGKRNFDACQVKTVSSTPVPRRNANLAISRVGCPRVQDDGVTFDVSGQSYFFSRRYRQLRNEVAQYICEGCVYPHMSPTEVAETRIELASKELERLKLVGQIATATEEQQPVEDTVASVPSRRPARVESPPGS